MEEKWMAICLTGIAAASIAIAVAVFYIVDASIQIEAIKAGLVQDVKDGKIVWIQPTKDIPK